MMFPALTQRRATARAELLAKVTGAKHTPENPGVDATLKADTLTLYNAIAEKIGMQAFGQWLMMEYPWLEKPTTPLLRVWWILQRFHDELMGIEHRGWYIATRTPPHTPRCPACAGSVQHADGMRCVACGGESAQGEEMMV